MSEKFSDKEIDRLLNSAYCPSLPLKEIVRQLRERIEWLETRESKLVWMISDGKLSEVGYEMGVLESEFDETLQKYAEKGVL